MSETPIPVKRGRGRPKSPPSQRLPRHVDRTDAVWYIEELNRSGLTSRALFGRMRAAYEREQYAKGDER